MLGVNGCVFAYGQTGSGKSHTMFGADASDLVLQPPPESLQEPQVLRGGSARGVSDRAGLVPRCCAQLLEAIRRRRDLLGSGYSAVLNVSYVQVFGDQVTDLLHEEGTAAAPVMTLNAAQTVLSGALDRQVLQQECAPY